MLRLFAFSSSSSDLVLDEDELGLERCNAPSLQSLQLGSVALATAMARHRGLRVPHDASPDRAPINGRQEMLPIADARSPRLLAAFAMPWHKQAYPPSTVAPALPWIRERKAKVKCQLIFQGVSCRNCPGRRPEKSRNRGYFRGFQGGKKRRGADQFSVAQRSITPSFRQQRKSRWT